MKTVGITGRSGCGKSSVTEYLRKKGCPVADADAIAREVLLPGSPCLAELAGRFGAGILAPDGTLKRQLLADRAFATPAGTAALTDITHPEILRRILALREKAGAAGAALFFVDGAVIVGTPFAALCDALVLVRVPQEVSVRRICARDGIGAEAALRRLNAQLPEETLAAAADEILDNDGTLEQLYAKVEQLLDRLQEGGT